MDYSKDFFPIPKLFEIEYIKVIEAGSMPSQHFHDYFEVYYQLSGERCYFIKNRSYYVKKGDLVLVKPEELHKTLMANENQYERILICFKEDFLRGYNYFLDDVNMFKLFYDDINIIQNTKKEQAIIEDILYKMLEERNSKVTWNTSYMKLLLAQLIINANRSYSSKEHFNHEYPSALHLQISKITKYISDHFTDHLELDSLSEKFHISSYYLSRNFKLATGFTFIEYINSLRINEAKKLLAETNLNIISIALTVGFNNTTHFGRIFRELTNTTPSEYRKTSKAKVRKTDFGNLL